MFLLKRRRPVRSTLAGVVILAVAFSCGAQSSRVAGAIQGSVVDQTGGAGAGAIATLRNQRTKQTRSLSGNAGGLFRSWGRPVGQYALRVCLKVFFLICSNS